MDFLKSLNLKKTNPGASTGTLWLDQKGHSKLTCHSPIDGQSLGAVSMADNGDYDAILSAAIEARSQWQMVPAPRRGEIIRQIGEAVRDVKEPLGHLIAWETGKLLQEGLGEVQEMIDVCDFAVGQSRMLYGMTSVSERPDHRLYDQYHPLGIVGIITAFNFPLAVWSWNAMIATVCGDVCIWKPSSKAPLTAIALQHIVGRVLQANKLPEGIFSLIIGDRDTIGDPLLTDKRIPLISFTGSVDAGRYAARTVAKRLGKTILELGGNNAIILTEYADLKLALPSVIFGAVGTTGQRCTSTRRLIVHNSIYGTVKKQLIKAYSSLRVGNPLKKKTHMGPLIDSRAVHQFRSAINAIKQQGGKILHGGDVLTGKNFPSKCYVQPTVAEVENHFEIVQEETFAPILYLIRYSGKVENGIALQNDVRQGLSSAIFTTNLRQAEIFLSCAGSDCGLANVNIGTSGAEIGGAFGGEKETGGGRESGSDAWKVYMRRQTVTSNYGTSLPLAQGISFDIK